MSARINIEGVLQQALAFHEKGNLIEADALYNRILELEPRQPEALHLSGVVAHQRGEHEKAIELIGRAISHKSNDSRYYNNLGEAFRAFNKNGKAITCYKKAIQLNSKDQSAWSNLGIVFKSQGKLKEAVASYERALAIDPVNANTHNNLGNALFDQGETEKAIGVFRRLLALKPHFAEAHSNYLLLQNYSPVLDEEKISMEHKAWVEKNKVDLLKISTFWDNRNPEKKLKIGYLSPDFKKHSIAFFLEPILAHHNKEEFDIFCYSAVISPDDTTARMKELVTHWRSIVGLSDEKATALIRKDGIDILIDLAGHTAKNRLPVFLHKPAPVQVSYLGYPNCTNLPTIDYRLTDSFADPPGRTDKWNTETLVRLNPTAWCYRPLNDFPPVSELPAREVDSITFGSFNNINKLNEKIINLWGRILNQFGNARLVLKSRSLADTFVQERIHKQFATMGIIEERVILHPHDSSSYRHLERYHDVDIAMDTFPYNGTTTTCESLYMGVPVITLEGKAHRSRVGVSLLNQVGLQHLIAKNEEEYVAIACSLTSDLDELAELRKSLRSRMEKSPLMDEVGFTRGLENAYREMWKKWVNG